MRSLKFLTILAIILLNFVAALAQLKYQKNYKKTLEEAAAKQIPVFITIEYKSVLDPPAEYFSSNFANYRVKHDSPEGNMLINKYGLARFPVILFVKPDGSLILKSEEVKNNKNYFLSYGTEAITRFKGNTGLADYDKLYHEGNHITRAFLKDYIGLRYKSGIFTNDKLIDLYVNLLPADVGNNYEEILFIYRAAPLLFGEAYSFTQQYRTIVDSLYKREPLQDRIWINTRMINNTLSEAIRTKDYILYDKVSSFVYKTVAPDHAKIEPQQSLNRLIFYKGINDTIGFFRQAQVYYDRYFMSISLDSIKRDKQIEPTSNSSNELVFMERKGHLSVGNYHDKDATNTAFILNNAAWDFYTYGTKNLQFLYKAVMWSQRSIDIDPKATHYDTLAHLLYRIGLFDAALLYQEKAIQLAKKKKELSKAEINGFREEAKKMKSRSL
ncbi:hypothetical protein [Pedobacter psychroterrae]|uniref:Tetratricopeptide repeat protein n=1 Tax=Pedobacter psychroterrae TaxID=2530453 RepID=A0A4R0NI87_9SPHI|nr:hypothetical protein [Pedobacter psychroterrae]TCC99938.1 hypothetical protein EZ437_17010 [Pedobacter psychroterrae]